MTSAPQFSAWEKKPSAWALDAEKHEEELNQQRQAIEAEPIAAAAAAAAAVVAVPEAEFPSLTAAVATKGKKKKAQKTTLSLAEFSNYSSTKERGLSHEEVMYLPTGPRERTAEEMERSRFGGGFGRSSWGGDGGGGLGFRDEGRRSSRGVSREPLGPSRADELGDWNVGKSSVVANRGGFERRGRSDWSVGKADELDSWVSGKKNIAPVETGRRYVGLSSNGGADAETWGRKRVVDNGSSEGRPKLNLKPRSVPLSNYRPQSPDVLVVKQESYNPFGAARPREEVLAEKGQDWKKVDEQFESLKIKERPGSGWWRGEN